MAARKRKGTKDNPWPEKTRERIRTSMLANRLTDHVLGKCEMTTSQVTAAVALLKKTLPDLAQQNINVKGEIEQHILGLVQGLDANQSQPDEDVTIQ